MYQHTHSTHSEEDIHVLMDIEYILNESTEQPKRLRAGSEFPGMSHVAYPGHPPFSHSSMGMDLLNSGFDILPVAKSDADLVLNEFGDGSGDSLDTIESPYMSSVGSPYCGSPKSPRWACSSPREDVSEPSMHRVTTNSSSLEDVSEGTSPATSPWLTGGILDGEPKRQFWGTSDRLNDFWVTGPISNAKASAVEQPYGPRCGSLDENAGHVGHNPAVSAPVKLTGESQITPFQLSSFDTQRERPRGYRTNRHVTRYEDGEVLRYGAGESYRPFNNGNRDRERSPPPRRARTPLRARSPIRDRDRDLRGRTPPIVSDSYVPNRSPRRRSRSPDRYRGPDRARDMGGESWRRRDNSRARMRSPVRRMSPRRSPRRSPGRFSPGPRRDDRFDRARSPRRDFDIRDRRRSRSPIDRNRQDRARSPMRRSPPPARGGASYRPPLRSRSPDRRDDRYGPGPSFRRPSPMRERESAIASAVTSRSNSRSRNPSPRPISRGGYDNRSRPHSPLPRSPAGFSDANSIPVPARSATPRNQTPLRSPPRARSPPRGPAALRAPPTGPSATRSFTVANGTPAPSRYPATPAGPHSSRADVTSPTVPPSGPRGYVPTPRGGGFSSRGGRGSWSGPSSRFAPPPVSPATPHSANTNSVPTGPRASISGASSPSLLTPKPFNPPTGPAAQGGQRMTMAQNLIAGMPAIVPGGRLDPNSVSLTTGVTKDLEAHHRRLKEEEERLRGELRVKDEKLRVALRMWERLDRESKSYELKSDLSDQSLRKIAGEGAAGAAF